MRFELVLDRIMCFSAALAQVGAVAEAVPEQVDQFREGAAEPVAHGLHVRLVLEVVPVDDLALAGKERRFRLVREGVLVEFLADLVDEPQDVDRLGKPPVLILAEQAGGAGGNSGYPVQEKLPVLLVDVLEPTRMSE